MAGEVLLPLVDLDVQLANGTESRVRGFADQTVGALQVRLAGPVR